MLEKLVWIYKVVTFNGLEVRQAVDLYNLFLQIQWIVNNELGFTSVSLGKDCVVIVSACSGASLMPQRRMESRLSNAIGYQVNNVKTGYGINSAYHTEIRLPKVA